MKRVIGGDLGWWLAFGSAWLWSWIHLADGWFASPQYQYGAAVPLVFIFMVIGRLNEGEWKPEPGGQCSWIPWVVCGWIVLVIAELLRRQDPVWRFVGSLFLLASSLLSAGWFLRIGGRRLLRRQLFALAFAWLALPWPVPLERALTLHLLNWATQIATTLSNLVGIPALQHGNVIELTRGCIGMGAACSGIESFQSSLVACLCLGELRRLDHLGRIALVLGGWLIAFSGNLLRLFGLILLVSKYGQQAVVSWHDRVGICSTIFIFCWILLCSMLMQGKPASARRAAPVALPVAPMKPEESGGARGGTAGWLVCASVYLVPILATWWFSGGPALIEPLRPRWKLGVENIPGRWAWQVQQPTQEERDSFHVSQWECLTVRTPEGRRAQIAHLFWTPRRSLPGIAFFHTPALCLSSTGWTELEPAKVLSLNVRGERMAAVGYHFSNGSTKQRVYQILIQGGKIEPLLVAPEGVSRWERFSSLWSGPKGRVSEELLIALQGIEEEQEATPAAEEFFNVLLVE